MSLGCHETIPLEQHIVAIPELDIWLQELKDEDEQTGYITPPPRASLSSPRSRTPPYWGDSPDIDYDNGSTELKSGTTAAQSSSTTAGQTPTTVTFSPHEPHTQRSFLIQLRILMNSLGFRR